MGRKGRAFEAQSVHAIIVTAGKGDLDAVLAGVARQTRQVDFVTVVTVGAPPATLAGSLAERFGDRAWVVGPVKASNFGEAIRQALTSSSMEQDPVWYWFLHDDSIPMKAALRELMKVGTHGGTVALVGAKQVEEGAPDQVLEVGIEATGSGRRVDLSIVKEIDQGQYDGRRDVLAVGTAGMLVKADIWKQTRGLDPHLGPFGDGLEYGRRLRRAGYRVLVAPKAVVEHRQQSLGREGRGEASFRARREAQLYNWLLTLPLLLVPLMLIMLAPWSIVRAIARLIWRRPRLAPAELGAYLDLLLALPALGRARRRLRRGSKIPRRALVELEMSPNELESWRRNQRRIDRSRVREYDRVDRATATVWHRHTRTARIALLSLLGLTIAASVLAWYPYLHGMVGADWAELPVSATKAWDQAWSTWVFSGVGSAGAANPVLTLFAALSLPLSLLGVTPTQVAQAFLVAAMPLATLGGWAVARLLTHVVAARAMAGVLWGTNPLLLFALTQGNLSAVLAWTSLPFVLSGLWIATGSLPALRLRGVDEVALLPRMDALTGGGFAAVALLFGAAGAPILVVVTAVVGYAMALLPNRSDHPGLPAGLPARTPAGFPIAELPERAPTPRRLLAATLAWLPAAIVLGPTWAWAFQHLDHSREVASALLDPSGSGILGSLPSLGSTPLLVAALAALGMAPLWALVSLIRTSPAGLGRPWVVRTAFLIGVLALVGGAVSVSMGGGVSPLVPFALASLSWTVAGIAGNKPLVLEAAGLRDPRRRLLGPLVAVVGCALAGASAVGILALGPFGYPANEGSVRAAQGLTAPLVAREASVSDRAGRLLAVSEDDGAILADLWRSGVRQQADLSIGIRAGEQLQNSGAMTARGLLAEAIGTLAIRPSDQVASVFASLAIELVMLPTAPTDGAGADALIATLTANLDSSEGFERIGTTELGTMWRVRPTDRTPAWAMLADGTPIPGRAAGVRATVTIDSGTDIYLAEVADPGWKAWLGGQALKSVIDEQQGWRQTFEVPSDLAGDAAPLRIAYLPAWRIWWLAGVIASVAVAAVMALPLRLRGPLWLSLPEDSSGEVPEGIPGGSTEEIPEEPPAEEVDDES